MEDVSVVGKSKKNKYRPYSYVTCGNPPPAMFGFTDKTITTFPPTHQLHIVAVKNELWSKWTQSADKKLRFASTNQPVYIHFCPDLNI